MPDRTHRHAPRRYKPWTPAEDAVLRAAAPGTRHTGASHRELAVRLGRSTTAVTDRLLLLRREASGA